VAGKKSDLWRGINHRIADQRDFVGWSSRHGLDALSSGLRFAKVRPRIDHGVDG
jgi:hypothetical protein